MMGVWKPLETRIPTRMMGVWKPQRMCTLSLLGRDNYYVHPAEPHGA